MGVGGEGTARVDAVSGAGGALEGGVGRGAKTIKNMENDFRSFLRARKVTGHYSTEWAPARRRRGRI